MSENEAFVCVARLEELNTTGCLQVQVNGHAVALFAVGEKLYAVDNRCPHMGFPLDRGTVKEGILTCHWHHARFDLESGGTFDQWADDVRTFPVEVRDGEVWISTLPKTDPHQHQKERLQVGLERNLPLVIGKAVLTLIDGRHAAARPFQAGFGFGVTYRRQGWGQGLTILGCLANMLPYLDESDRPRAMYHGLSAVAADSFGHPPRFPVRPLPEDKADFPALKRWFRQFVAVRDSEGAERCVVSAIRAGASSAQMADMLFSAVTDFRYVDVGHPADFTNKAFEALDIAGWSYAESALTSLVRSYANASRMEESNAWRNPVDLIAILNDAFDELPEALDRSRRSRDDGDGRIDRGEVTSILLGDDPADIAEVLLAALASGYNEVELASTVSYAAALRIARFHTSNEFSDWDTALHTFTFANAIEQGLRRAPSIETTRGVFDAAMSVYLDRFLNIPAARLPEPSQPVEDPDQLLGELANLLDRQQQVNQAAELVARFMAGGGEPERLMATLGHLLLREDRDFHTIQTVEAAYRQYSYLKDSQAGMHVLVAAGRYLAAHAPTVRSQEQTYNIAYRLHRGDRLFEYA